MRWTKYRHLTLLGIFSDEVISNTDFTDEAVVPNDVPVVKTLSDDGDIQIITNKFWWEYITSVSETNFLNIVLVSQETKAYNLVQLLLLVPDCYFVWNV